MPSKLSGVIVHHVQIAIPAGGEAAARAFYAGLLGFEDIPKPSNLAARGGLWLQGGSIELHLGVDPEFRPSTRAHIACLINDLHDLRARLETAGYPVIDDESLPRFDRFYTSDPFGNRVECLRPADTI